MRTVWSAGLLGWLWLGVASAAVVQQPVEQVAEDVMLDLHLDETSARALLSDALRALGAGEHAAAATAARAVTASYPDAGFAFEVLGVAEGLLGNLDEAVTALEAAARLQPARSSPWTKLGEVYLARERDEDAERVLTHALEINPDDRFAHQRLGLLYERRGELEAAVRHFRDGVAAAPASYLGVRVNLARSLAQLGRPEEAATAIDPFLDDGYSGPSAFVVSGDLNLRLGRLDLAERRFRRVLELTPDVDAGLLGLGLTLRAKEQPQESLSVLQRLAELRPDWPVAQLELGEAELRAGHLEPAMTAFERVLAANPQSRTARAGIAATHLAAGRAAQAATTYRDGIAAGMADFDLYARLSELELAAGDPTGAEGTLRAAVERFPASGYAQLRLGSLLASLRRYDAALGPLQQATALAPQDPRGWRALAETHGRLAAWTEAVAAAEKLLALRDGAADRVRLALWRERAGDLAGAAAEYRRVLELQPGDALASNNLANVLVELGELEAAEASARQAAAAAPQNGAVLDTLGWVLARRGAHAEAAPLLEKALQARPDSATVRYHLGAVYQDLGETAKARELLQSARQASADASWAADADSRLQRLQ